MANVIVDAGTDAKIAKFQKRGIELIDLAFIEPVEVWGQKEGRKKNGEGELGARRESMRISVDEAGVVTNLSMGSMSQSGSANSRGLRSTRSSHSARSRPGSEIRDRTGNGSVNLSTTPSAVSLSSQPTYSSAHGGSSLMQDGSQENRHLHPSSSRTSMRSESFSPSSAASITPTASSPPISVTASTSTPKKNIFGKLFNKKNTTTPTLLATPHSKQTEGLPSFSSFSILQSPRTPKAQQAGKQIGDDEMSTPTVQSSKEKRHSRNLSLTGITAPLKSTLKNRNRSSGLVAGSLLSNAATLTGLGITEDKSRLSVDKNKGRDSSPNPSLTKSMTSRVSWVGTTTTQSTDSLEAGQKDGNVNATATSSQPFPSMVAPSQTEGTANARQQQQQQLQLRPPVLGIQPTFVSSIIAPSGTHLSPNSAASPLVAVLSPKATSEKEAENLLKGQRALMYMWFVRRWLKRRPSTILGTAVSEITGGVGGFFGKKKEPSSQDTSIEIAGPSNLSYGGVEVRFEWKRAKGKEARRAEGRKRGRGNRTASGFSSIAVAGVESDAEAERLSVRSRERSDTLEKVKKEEKRKYRMSTGSVGISISEENGFGTEGGRQMKNSLSAEDDGNESDPEDSETPWVCTLKIRRSAAAHSSTSVTCTTPPPVIPESQVLRVKVGTLSPTPHHPKVVAMLKVPFPLPDVEVERMVIVKRDARSAASSPQQEDDSEEMYTGLKLTAEEIKDVVCSTGLWLVVREGFGGVGKVTRKGDGWRIRG